ncbi:MAG: hypothetical protein ACI97A_001016 [Planctomycetota bacterium]|jgi:hypothetical protein
MSLKLSVIIPSVTGWSDLERCLRALISQADTQPVELVVPERLGGDLPAKIKDSFPQCVVIEMAGDSTIPAMRALGFERSSGDAIAVLEDHVIVPTDWAKNMLHALTESDGVVAGAVENGATTTLMDRAAFLCEYSHCMPPIEGGAVEWLTGNNVVYRRELIDQHEDILKLHKWENVLHDAMKDGGARLICHPEIVVSHELHYGPFDYFGQRYLYARSYAGARVRGFPLHKRLIFGCAAFILPPILLFRIFSRVYAKRRDRGTLFASIPLILLFVMAWAWGEIVGYWFGAGDSLARVR